MNQKRNWMIFVLSVTIFFVGFIDVTFSRSFEPPELPPHHESPRFGELRHPPFSPEDRDDLRKRIGLIRMWRLTEELNLSEEKADKLFPLLHQFDNEKVGLEKEKAELMKDLQKCLKDEDIEESKLEDLIEKLEKNQSAREVLEKEKLGELKQILSPQEQAKLILFVESFPREIQGIIRGAKKKERGGRGRKSPCE
ncbi:MAG: hypothetical protein SV775_12720 [Thermodesulfobacteriota bacterium]|nr:hypothetical protein [Thermodesulfobacteriota bacterium]